jgi:hypothetical protein
MRLRQWSKPAAERLSASTGLSTRHFQRSQKSLKSLIHPNLSKINTAAIPQA